ncbi:MAG: divalent metal cation transporter [Bacteroidales bacterium]
MALVGLIGTTVVPYNLFLHASAVQEQWHSPSDLPESGMGYLGINDPRRSDIDGCHRHSCRNILGAGGGAGTGTGIPRAQMLRQWRPLAGRWAKYIISISLFAAGISSAITAPVAASTPRQA